MPSGTDEQEKILNEFLTKYNEDEDGGPLAMQRIVNDMGYSATFQEVQDFWETTDPLTFQKIAEWITKRDRIFDTTNLEYFLRRKK